MAENPYVNKVELANGETVMDISDSDVQPGDVLQGRTFYAASGQRSTGTLGDFTGATASTDGTSGLVPAPEAGDEAYFLRGDGEWADGGRPMVILSYGHSTWNDFITAYKANVIVYCRASSSSNPGTGTQGRMAFMAYVNNGDNPTEVEFQYYRSVSSHSSTQMGDQVFVYKLVSSGGGTWSVTTREASIKAIKAATNSKIGVSWSNNEVTLSNTMTAADMPMSSSDTTTAGEAISSLNSQLTNIKIEKTTYTNFTLAANGRTTIFPTAPTVPTGYKAYLLNTIIGINTNVYMMGVQPNDAYVTYWNATGTAYSGTSFPMYCSWLILPNS